MGSVACGRPPTTRLRISRITGIFYPVFCGGGASDPARKRDKGIEKTVGDDSGDGPMRGEARPSDEILAARARAGDEAAFRELCERHAPRLRPRVRRRLPTALRRKVSESDIIQDACLGAHLTLERFEDRGEGSFRRWLGRIVDHKVNDVLRKFLGTAKRGAVGEVSRHARPETRNVAGGGPTPSQVAEASELEERVREALEELPEHYRLVIRLVREDGLTLAETADRMGRSAGAVEKLYGRALSRLAALVRVEEREGR
jgi:RNA polymerase sigma-70 factor (ECF subfamily)